MERYLSVGEVFEKSKTIQYIYGLGEYWLHQITLAFWKEHIRNIPVSCILASEVAPLEGMGSPDVYAEKCNRSYREINDMRQWFYSFDKKGLELSQINKTLGRL